MNQILFQKKFHVYKLYRKYYFVSNYNISKRKEKFRLRKFSNHDISIFLIHYSLNYCITSNYYIPIIYYFKMDVK